MKRFVLIGLPNTGKSTLFNRLTGMSQRVGNWPGLTIELSSARLLLGGHMVELVDLPGVNDLTGYSDDEAVVRDVLQASAFDGAILVLNASQLDRQLPLALQVLASGLNCHVVLNMADEAKALGVSLDVERLSERLGAPVSLVSAKRMQGWPPLMTGLNRLANADAPAARAAGRGAGNAGGDGAGVVEAGGLLGLAAGAAGAADREDRSLADASVAGPPLFFALMALLFNLTYQIGTPLQDLAGAGLDWVKEQALTPCSRPCRRLCRAWRWTASGRAWRRC